MVQVIRNMIEHAATCRSGDTTLVAGEDAIEAVVAEPADDYFVFLVSDANLQGYGVSPEQLSTSLTSNAKVRDV